MSTKTPPIIYCPACRGLLAQTASKRCPRCGAEVQSWQWWGQAESLAHFSRFFLRSLWGWVALFSLLLPLVSWGTFRFEVLSLDALILGAALLISSAGLYILFANRDQLWLDELTRRTVSPLQNGWWPLGGLGFLTFIGLGGVLAGMWSEAARQGVRPAFTALNYWGTLLIGFAFVSQTLAAGLYSLDVYGRWRLRSFPPPIFLNETSLRQLVTVSLDAQPKLKLDTDTVQTCQVVGVKRTRQAGLKLIIRLERNTEKVSMGSFLKGIEHWQVTADKWGYIQSIAEIDRPQYKLDPARPGPLPGLESPQQVLEGEIIFPDDR